MQIDLANTLNDPQTLESLYGTALDGVAWALSERLQKFLEGSAGEAPDPVQMYDLLRDALKEAVLVGKGQYASSAPDARAALLLLVSASNVSGRVFETESAPTLTERMLSTEDVARLLNVSRPYVVKLADAGQLGIIQKTEGGQRRISAAAVEVYRREQRSRAGKALAELGTASQEAGIYGATKARSGKEGESS